MSNISQTSVLEDTLFFTIDFNNRVVTSRMLFSCRNIPITIHILVNDQNPAEYEYQTNPKIIIHHQQKNLGYAGAWNHAIKLAKKLNKRFVFHFNNDIEIQPGSNIEDFLTKLSTSESYALLSPTVMTTRNTIEFAGTTWISKYLSAIVLTKRKPIKTEPAIIESAFIDGCCFAVDTKKLPSTLTSKLDENYFAYREEHDWAFRLRKTGLKVGYLPSFTVIHKGAGTFGRFSVFKEFLLTRNQLYFARKNLKYIDKLAFQLIFFIKLSIKLILKAKNKELDSAHGVFLGLKNQIFKKEVIFNIGESTIRFSQNNVEIE